MDIFPRMTTCTDISRNLPTAEELKAALLQAICDAAKRHGMSMTVFCRRAVGDSKFPATLRDPKRSITLRTYGMVIDFIRLLDDGPAAAADGASADGASDMSALEHVSAPGTSPVSAEGA